MNIRLSSRCSKSTIIHCFASILSRIYLLPTAPKSASIPEPNRFNMTFIPRCKTSETFFYESLFSLDCCCELLAAILHPNPAGFGHIWHPFDLKSLELYKTSSYTLLPLGALLQPDFLHDRNQRFCGSLFRDDSSIRKFHRQISCRTSLYLSPLNLRGDSDELPPDQAPFPLASVNSAAKLRLRLK